LCPPPNSICEIVFFPQIQLLAVGPAVFHDRFPLMIDLRSFPPPLSFFPRFGFFFFRWCVERLTSHRAPFFYHSFVWSFSLNIALLARCPELVFSPLILFSPVSLSNDPTQDPAVHFFPPPIFASTFPPWFVSESAFGRKMKQASLSGTSPLVFFFQTLLREPISHPSLLAVFAALPTPASCGVPFGDKQSRKSKLSFQSFSFEGAPPPPPFSPIFPRGPRARVGLFP